jgi:hypothetical protein
MVGGIGASGPVPYKEAGDGKNVSGGLGNGGFDAVGICSSGKGGE